MSLGIHHSRSQTRLTVLTSENLPALPVRLGIAHAKVLYAI